MSSSDPIKSKDAHAYLFAFKLGLVGCIMLTAFGIKIDVVTTLFALGMWSIFTLFFFPYLYLKYLESEFNIPFWFIRGPHR